MRERESEREREGEREREREGGERGEGGREGGREIERGRGNYILSSCEALREYRCEREGEICEAFFLTQIKRRACSGYNDRRRNTP